MASVALMALRGSCHQCGSAPRLSTSSISVTTRALPPAWSITPPSQSSTSPPERITSFATATACASLGRGSYSCGSAFGWRICLTGMSGPATARVMSATWVVVATTAGLPLSERQAVTVTAATTASTLASNRPGLGFIWKPKAGRSKRPHVRTARGEAGAAHLAVARLGAEALEEGAGLLPVAPEQHRRPCARDRGADGAELAGGREQLHRARVQRRPALLVDAVRQPAGHEVEVAAGEAQHEQRRVRRVVDGVGDRHLGRQRGAGLHRRDLLRRNRQHALESRHGVEAHGRPVVRAHHEPSVDGRAHVVGMPLELRREVEQRRVELEDVVGRGEPRHDGRGRRAEAGGRRDLGLDAEAEVVGRLERLEGPHAEIRPIERHARHVALDRERAPLLHLELEVEAEGGRHRVIARAEVGRRRGHPHDSVPPHGASTARSTASIDTSQGTTCAARFRAVCGSFSPWPVSTQTTRPDAPYFRSPATDAAEAGSQKTPSRAPSSAYASRISSSLTARISPRDEVTASIASSHRAGFPMRMADATVSGDSTGAP